MQQSLYDLFLSDLETDAMRSEAIIWRHRRERREVDYEVKWGVIHEKVVNLDGMISERRRGT